jgi:hypothetical protein
MKKYFIRVAEFIQKTVDNFVIKRFSEIMPHDLIVALYHRIAQRDLRINVKTVYVKKGKIKYTLVICKDRDCKTVFNLGRHYEQAPVISTR